MNPTWLVLNLLLNSACSFAAGALIVFAVVRLFRIEGSRWKLLLLCLPFAKILWDLAMRGVPATSIVYSGIDPLGLPPKHQTLTLSAGFSDFGPIIALALRATAMDGREYATSLGDYAFAWISRHVGAGAPFALLVALLAASGVLVLRRLGSIFAFERKRRRQRADDKGLRRIPLFFRAIDVYQSDAYAGSPFTGGILKPYICFPSASLRKLTDGEANAVLRHEVAHVKQWDLAVALAIGLLGDALWLIPGYKFLARKIDRLRELLADRSAVRSGARPEQLASSLLKLGESAAAPTSYGVPYSAFFRETSLLKTRVNALLGVAADRSRLGWRFRGVRVAVTALTAGAVMMATFGGNHEVSGQALPKGFEHFLKALGVL